MIFDVIAIGTATRDAFLKSEDFVTVKDKRFKTGEALCLSLGSKIEIPEIVFTTGGGATNAAATFARQDLKTACLTKVGDDVSGETIKRELAKEGIFTGFVNVSKELPTAYSIIVIAPSGERTVLVYRGVSEKLRKSEIPWPQLKAKWFYIAPLGGENAKLFEPLVKFAAKNKIKIAVDPSASLIKLGLKKLKPLLKNIDVFKCNQEEASYLTGIPFQKEKEIFKKFDELIPGIAVMTKGPEGLSVSDGKFIYQAGTYKEKRVVDRTGAGDAFGSGFLAGLMHQIRNYPLADGFEIRNLPPGAVEYAISLGTANATSKVEHIGAKAGLLAKADFEKRFKLLKIKKIALS